MSLNSLPSYPNTGCYVLKLHRESTPDDGRIKGLLEHLATGDRIPFDSSASLLAELLLHAASVRMRPAT